MALSFNPTSFHVMQRVCRPLAYVGIAAGMPWSAVLVTSVPTARNLDAIVDFLRLSTALLVRGLPLAALAHCDELGKETSTKLTRDPP